MRAVGLDGTIGPGEPMNHRVDSRGFSKEPIAVLVRTGHGGAKHYALGERHPGFTDVVDEIVRVPQYTDRGMFTRYKGKRYVISGGWRTDHWINLSLPAKKRRG